MPEIPISTRPKPFVFVLMPFDTKFDDIYKFGIKGAADDVGAYAERVDEQKFAEGILDRIFNQINKADVIVADMTGRNPNVFYEVGYAHALGKLVLLLTQNVDDIPFDLKHRQHTVYGGKINILREELASTLQWALEESKARRIAVVSDRLSLSMGEIELPELGSETDNPLIERKITSARFIAQIQIRNDNTETVGGVTHVYLFTGADVYYGLRDTSRGWIKPFKANAHDSEDGLVNQFRLPIQVPSMPPGAVESIYIDFMISHSSSWDHESQYRLRLHTPTRFHDYRFRLNLHREGPEPPPDM